MTSRRKFVLGGLAASALLPRSAMADIVCSDYNYNGVQQCTAGVQIGNIRTAEQECQNWCWAACIEAIFRIHGRNVSQGAIVDRLFGSPVCNTATGPQIVGTINGQWRTVEGDYFYAQAAPLLDLSFGVNNPQAAAQAMHELEAGNPLINGALGHATVLTAMTFLRDVYGQGQPLELVVRDPWPYRPNRRVLTAQEAAGTFFIAKVTVD